MFKDIPFTNNKYAVSKTGEVRRNKDLESKSPGKLGRILKPHINNEGYYVVNLRINNITESFLVHRLVAITFLDNPNNYPVVNHIDSNRMNNRVENLEWCTYSHNNKHGYETGNRTLTEKQIEVRRKPSTHLYKKVAKIDKNTGDILEVYNSITEASRKNGDIGVSNISSVCKGNYGCKTAGGFKWKFID